MKRTAPTTVALALLIGAFGAYMLANLIHNRFGLDPAIAPAALLLTLVLWRRRPVLLVGAALLIALPSFLFLRWSALMEPTTTASFANHVALLAGGVLATGAVIAQGIQWWRVRVPAGG